MKRQLTSILLFSALLVGGASTFVSCTDHESDSAYDTSVSQIAKLTELNKWLGELKETNPDLASAIDARIQANMDVIKDGVYADKERFEAAIQGSEAYKNLKGDVEGVDSRVSALERLRLTDSIAAKKITDALNHRLDSVSGSLNSALNTLLEQKLDGITVNATENPVTGYWNASFTGLNLKLASSFYGVAAEAAEDNWDVKANQVLGKGGNAGYLYVSLNPTEIDPSLVKVELVNSQGEPAKGFKLGDIDNTDKVLTFGTKAATVSANGFYQVPVIASDPQNDGVEFDKGALAAAAKNALNELKNPKSNDLDLSLIASALYKNIPVLTAYGVKAEYYLYNPDTKNLELKKTVKHAVSDYDIAAFAVKPVSFNFLKDNATLDKLSDWAVENFRLPSLSSKLDKVIDALNVEISYDKADEFYTYSVITPNGLFCQQDGNDVVIYGQGTDLNNGQLIDGELYRIKNATVEKKFVSTGGSAAEFVFVIKTKDSTIADLLASANKQIAGKLQPIKNVLSNVNAKWENVIAKVNPLLKKVASKIGSANKLLQPTILYVDQNGNPNTLSTIGGRLGTRFVGTGATTLYATSWTAELLAPAYKKSISVLEEGATVTLADRTTSAAEPFDGSINKVIFNAKKAGTYTIVYKAIDYSGVEVEKTFNVVVE